MGEQRESWHLSKSFSIGVVITCLFNGGSLLFYAGRLDNKIDDHERRIVIVEQFNNSLHEQLREMCERTARLEAKTDDVVKSLDRITGMLQAEKRK